MEWNRPNGLVPVDEWKANRYYIIVNEWEFYFVLFAWHVFYVLRPKQEMKSTKTKTKTTTNSNRKYITY